MRAFGIWTFGLLAAAIIGGLAGSQLDTSFGTDKGFFGACAGMFTFACLRLWLAGKKPG